MSDESFKKNLKSVCECVVNASHIKCSVAAEKINGKLIIKITCYEEQLRI